MNGRVILPMAAIAAFFVLCFCLLIQTQRLEVANIKADGLEQEANSAATVTRNALRTISIMNIFTEANQSAKQQITLESQRATADIKVAVAGDDCVNRNIPHSATQRVRKFADSLRPHSSGTATGQSNR